MITDILDTAERLSKIQNATLNNTDGAKRIQDIVSALDGLDETAINTTVSLTNLSDADKQLIADKIGVTIATTADKAATDADTASKYANLKVTNLLKVAWSKFTSFAMANPWLVAIAGAIGVIALIAKGVDLATTSTEEHREKLDELKGKYSEIASELSSLNSELETTKSRMEELEGKGALTFTEKKEYDNLVKQNNELQRRIDLLALEEKQANKEKNKAFVETMQSDTQDVYEYTKNDSTGHISKGNASLNSFVGGMSGSTVTYSMASEEDFINQQFKSRKENLLRIAELELQLKEDIDNEALKLEKSRLEKSNDEIDSYLKSKSVEWANDSEGINYISKPSDADEEAVNANLDFIADFQDRMAIALGGENAESNAFNRIVDNWKFDELTQDLQDLGSQGKVTADMLADPKYDEFIAKLVELGVIDSADNLEDIALAFNKVAEATGGINPDELSISYETIATTAETESDSVDTLRKSINSVTQAFKEQSENGQISVDTMLSMVEAGYATALQFDATTGACTINRDAMLDLVRAKIKNQIIDLQNLQTDIQTKLKEDGITAQESANGFYDLAKAKLASASAEQMLSMEQFNNATAQINALQNAMKNLDKIGNGAYSTSFGGSSSTNSFKDTLDKHLDLYEAELNAGLISFDDFLNKSRSMLDDYYRDGKISASDYWGYVEDLQKKQLDVYDRVLSAVTNRIDEEISLIEKQKDAIQDTIDKLREENDEHERAVNLEKARYELARLQTQRTRKVYTGNKGYIYDYDHSAIQDAQENLKDLELEELIAGLEKEQDALDDSIKKLEDYKKEWQSITDKYQKEQDELLAAQMFGADWEDKILSGRLDILNTFANNYISTQEAIAEAAWKSANAQIAAINAIRAAELNVDDTTITIEPDKSASGYEYKHASTDFETNTFENDALLKQQLIAQKKKEEAEKELEELKKKGKGSIGNTYISAYSSGTENAKRGVGEVSEDGDEIILDNQGGATLAKGHQLYNFEGGERVIKASETVKILQNQGNLIPVETMFGNIDTSKFMQNMPNITPNINLPKFDYSMINRNTQPSINIGDIHLHEVQNVDSFTKELNKHLPSVSIQFRGKH